MPATHTPGPWAVQREHGTDGGTVWYVEGRSDDDRRIIRAAREADARLIAAAPDLLAACVSAREMLLEAAQYLSSDQELIALETADLLTAAIEKATR